MSNFLKRDKHNRWKGGKPKCSTCGKQLSTYGAKNCSIHRKHTEETKKKMSERMKLHPLNYWLGKKRPHLSEETKRKQSEAQKKIVASGRHHLWKGGVSSENRRLRTCLEYKLWRKSVFERDDYTCIWCGLRGVRLEADHIKPFALFPELRFAIDNGRTLCRECHQKTDNYGISGSALAQIKENVEGLRK